MHAAVPFRRRIITKPLDRHIPHARHDSHAEHHVNGIGDLKADFGQRRIGRPHDIGNDKHGSPAHRTLQHSLELGVSFRWLRPIVRWSGFLFRRRANEGELLNPGNVVRV